jgi:hypothetical protein
MTLQACQDFLENCFKENPDSEDSHTSFELSPPCASFCNSYSEEPDNQKLNNYIDQTYINLLQSCKYYKDTTEDTPHNPMRGIKRSGLPFIGCVLVSLSLFLKQTHQKICFKVFRLETRFRSLLSVGIPIFFSSLAYLFFSGFFCFIYSFCCKVKGVGEV